MRRALLSLLLLTLPAFSDTVYTFSGGNYGFTWNATTQNFENASQETYNQFLGHPADAHGGMSVTALPNWPYPVLGIQFSSVLLGPPGYRTLSTDMGLAMLDNDGSGEPISVYYQVFGFTGDLGTYHATEFDGYGLPSMTLTVSDPPSDLAPEPASAGLAGAVLLFCLFPLLRKAIR